MSKRKMVLVCLALCFSWIVLLVALFKLKNYVKSAEQEIEMLDRKATIIEKVIFPETMPIPSATNPLERIYDRLKLGMEREKALAIVEEEYPLQNNKNHYSWERNAGGEYVWRWKWEKEIDQDITESAKLTITFTREGDCIRCKVANAVYEYANDAVNVRQGLR